jgi:hypothetical protein
LVWRPDHLDVATVTHDDASLLREPEVVAMTLEGFKKLIRSSIEKSSHARMPKGVAAPQEICITAALADTLIAQTIADICADQSFSVWVPPTAAPTSEGAISDLSAAEVDEEVRQAYESCSAFLLVYGAASSTWAAVQQRKYNKLVALSERTEPPRIVAIVDGPPADKPPPPVRLPRSRVINCRESLDPVRNLLAELHS